MRIELRVSDSDGTNDYAACRAIDLVELRALKYPGDILTTTIDELEREVGRALGFARAQRANPPASPMPHEK